MARTKVVVTQLTVDSAVAPTSTAVDTTNDHVITLDNPRKAILLISNTSGSTKTATVLAGDNPPAGTSGKGDLVISIANNASAVVTLEAARFLQADGTINVDLQAGFTAGGINVVELP